MSQDNSTRPQRWWLCGLLFIATALSFLDRQVLSVLAPVLTEELDLSSSEYSHVNTAFLASYAVMFLVGGRLMDLAGTRLGLESLPMAAGTVNQDGSGQRLNSSSMFGADCVSAPRNKSSNIA